MRLVKSTAGPVMPSTGGAHPDTPSSECRARRLVLTSCGFRPSAQGLSTLVPALVLALFMRMEKPRILRSAESTGFACPHLSKGGGC